MNIARINVGPRMSDAVVCNGIAYLSGKVPTNLSAGVKEQTENFRTKIEDILNQARSSKLDILRAEIYLADIYDWAKMNEAWDAWVPAGHSPARATVEAKLANPKYLVEIMITASISAN